MIFGEYFPNPAIFGTGPEAAALVSPLAAMLVEALGTAILVLVIFALSDPDNAAAPEPTLVPFFIGFTVAALISLFAPITQAGWNPARDLGPRLVALALGWGEVALPGPAGGFWVYLIGPLLGGPVGARLHWSFPDPSKATGSDDEQAAVYRRVRDAIRARIERELLAAG